MDDPEKVFARLMYHRGKAKCPEHLKPSLSEVDQIRLVLHEPCVNDMDEFDVDILVLLLFFRLYGIRLIKRAQPSSSSRRRHGSRKGRVVMHIDPKKVTV